MPSNISPRRQEEMRAVMRAALQAVDPAAAVRRCVQVNDDVLHIGTARYPLAEVGRIFVVGGGKAGAPMAAALDARLPGRIHAGCVNIKYGHATTAVNSEMRIGSLPGIASERQPPPGALAGPIRLVEAGHPTPDAAGVAGAEQIAALLGEAGERDLVIALLSGGGSALLPLPVAGVTLEDYRALTGLLLRCGADITEINTVRKHISRLQGGQMARLAAPARLAALILSDVVGSPLDVIASGPAVPDPTTYAGALAILQRYDLMDGTPASVRAHLERGAAGAIAETPKPGDPAFDRVTHVVIGDNASAALAAATEARQLGFQTVFLSSFIQGEAREVGKVAAGLAQGVAAGQSEVHRPACLIMGGETTVTLRGDGLGGRNQELALAAAIALDAGSRMPGAEVAVVSLATDGTDGPTLAAGGVATYDTAALGRAMGLDARAALAANDSLPYLDALGSLVITGPTGANVNDLIFVFVW
jgi:hydroxypyruvate reductase